MADTTALVPVFSGALSSTIVQLCDARTLHAFMQVRRDFSNWIKGRIRKFGFEVGADYITVAKLDSPDLANQTGRGGDRKSIDYHLTLDMAKELAMVENNEQGRAARRYFIECERKALELQPIAIPYAALPGDVLTQEQQTELRDFMERAAQKLPKDKRGAFLTSGWGKLKKHTGVPYRQIPQAQHTDALSLLARHAVEWEVVDEEPPLATDNEKIKHAFALASEVAKQAAMSVFNAVIDDQDVHKHDRWMFHMDWHARNGVPAPWAKPIEGNAMVVSMADLPRRLLEPNGMLPTNKELADLATACNQRLAQRMQYEASKAQANAV